MTPRPLTVEGYALDPRTVTLLSNNIAVARCNMRGRPWLRLTRKCEHSHHPGHWWVRAYSTKRDAVGGAL